MFDIMTCVHLANFQGFRWPCSLQGLQLSLEKFKEGLATATLTNKLLSKDKDKKVGAWCLQLLAEARSASGQHKEALSAAAEALKILRTCGDAWWHTLLCKCCKNLL